MVLRVEGILAKLKTRDESPVFLREVIFAKPVSF